MPESTQASSDRAKRCPPSTWDSLSYLSRATASASEKQRPVVKHYKTEPTIRRDEREVCEKGWASSRDFRSSSSTYASTATSGEELDEVPPPLEYPPLQHQVTSPLAAVPSTPPEFADFFPSTRKLRIRHDDCSQDNDMNLRVDTEIARSSGRPRDLILFHLRLQDLQARKFSLRRYCRYSGREVCHSRRKPQQGDRTTIRRSLSNALGSLTANLESPKDAGPPLKRYDSGYHSIADSENGSMKETGAPCSIMTLEFSNYAHVDIRKVGIGSSKRYDFQFWGKQYSWKRQTTRSPKGEQVSFDLYQNTGSKHAGRRKPVAHIVEDQMTPYEAYEEKRKRNWIPPCSMWISDTSILGGLTDVADVVVATGLVALVDCHTKRKLCDKR